VIWRRLLNGIGRCSTRRWNPPPPKGSGSAFSGWEGQIGIRAAKRPAPVDENGPCSKPPMIQAGRLSQPLKIRAGVVRGGG